MKHKALTDLDIAADAIYQLAPKKKRLTNETTDLVHPIRAALNSMPGVRVWRNNVGRVKHPDGHMFSFGLGEGSADLIGIMTVPSVDPSGEAGLFFALEVKRPGEKPTNQQLQWLAFVRKMGGFATVVHSIEEAHNAAERAKKGARQ